MSARGLLARPERTSSAGLQILSIVGAAAIVAIGAFFTSAQAQYRGGYYGGGHYGGYYGGGYGYRHGFGGYRPSYGYGPRYVGGYGYPRSYAGYFGPGYFGPGFGPGYYEVTELPTTYYDLPPYEEPGFNRYGGVVSDCSARFQSYNPYTGLYFRLRRLSAQLSLSNCP